MNIQCKKSVLIIPGFAGTSIKRYKKNTKSFSNKPILFVNEYKKYIQIDSVNNCESIRYVGFNFFFDIPFISSKVMYFDKFVKSLCDENIEVFSFPYDYRNCFEYANLKKTYKRLYKKLYNIRQLGHKVVVVSHSTGNMLFRGFCNFASNTFVDHMKSDILHEYIALSPVVEGVSYIVEPLIFGSFMMINNSKHVQNTSKFLTTLFYLLPRDKPIIECEDGFLYSEDIIFYLKGESFNQDVKTFHNCFSEKKQKSLNPKIKERRKGFVFHYIVYLHICFLYASIF